MKVCLYFLGQELDDGNEGGINRLEERQKCKIFIIWEMRRVGRQIY